MRGVHRESKQETYDVVVIGAGIGGLSTAALLAKAGKSVLLVERHDRPGGYAHSFKRRGFHFDSGVHLVSGCGPQGYQNGSSIYQICTAVGIDPQALFMPIESYARAVYPGCEITLQAGESAFIEGLCAHFPREKDNLRVLIRLCKVLAEEAMLAETILEQGRSARVSPAVALANLLRYRRASLSEALDEFLKDARLKSLCASLWPYLGLPPAQLSFLYWACMMAGYTYEGGYYCRGSFQAYANALAGALETHGGELLLNASVRQIVVEQGKVAGIVLENGQLIRADIVVSNADARQTAELLIGREYLPQPYCDHLAQLTPSTSIFVSYVATDLPMAEHAHESFFFESFDHEAAYASNQSGDFNWFSATLPSLTDPSLAPDGQHIMLLTTLCRFDIGTSWRQAKKPFEQRLLAKAERHFPGLQDHLLLVESGTPRTLERYTLNRQGAAYGFAATPEQIGPNRPGVRGVLPGLFHAGHWTRPGGGIAGVSISALLAAEAVSGRVENK
ncbi:MAG: NAD(P)/FAD-dependent oxidoreductase [Methylomonas sp.]|jgi:prolycopene isomerase|uniref:phytoene desaturase family protein n=1 Tax=Methylomonas sp. TaxID=418 RepID=UPI0025FEDFC6|nr:NAD(P)/FAD-dependent oxidoreductase [Methylomonas sp.]MCK9606584.1 NAD(P)/FAD-dependent oxidoreductase [Methylomonas sp.]